MGTKNKKGNFEVTYCLVRGLGGNSQNLSNSSIADLLKNLMINAFGPESGLVEYVK
jgi:hypothetical protein